MRLLSKPEESPRNVLRMPLLTLSVLLCLVCAANASSNPASARLNAGSAFDAISSSNVYFAIADFDGDRKPDLATVQVQSAASSRNLRYSVRFELSAGAAQSFGVIAPAGGLQIVARDVNGDSFLDLLVSTAWQHEQVAVFLNDGHGNFTLADPREFAASFRESTTKWNLKTAAFCDTAILDRPESSAGGMGSDRESELPLRIIGAAHSQHSFLSNQSLLLLAPGRAPPTAVAPA
ncbi:MAG TPA: VCBS repeat-containing protein [Candidatus Methylomirabilis sp.]|nr:VCBS repeat-containing protein [Candidatus Methylomirabilis sp.]